MSVKICPWDPSAYNMSFSAALNAPIHADNKKLHIKKMETIRREVEFPIVTDKLKTLIDGSLIFPIRLSRKDAIKIDRRDVQMYQDWVRSFGYEIIFRITGSGPDKGQGYIDTIRMLVPVQKRVAD